MARKKKQEVQNTDAAMFGAFGDSAMGVMDRNIEMATRYFAYGRGMSHVVKRVEKISDGIRKVGADIELYYSVHMADNPFHPRFPFVTCPCVVFEAYVRRSSPHDPERHATHTTTELINTLANWVGFSDYNHISTTKTDTHLRTVFVFSFASKS